MRCSSGLIARYLVESNCLITLAESCTGGALSAALTSIPGASAYFERGFVTYSILSKMELLSVPKSIIEGEGAVSEACAFAMAEGALAASHADCALAITGALGPDPVPPAPLGMVWVAFINRTGNKQSQHWVFTGNREQNRQSAIDLSLDWLLAVLTA